MTTTADWNPVPTPPSSIEDQLCPEDGHTTVEQRNDGMTTEYRCATYHSFLGEVLSTQKP